MGQSAHIVFGPKRKRVNFDELVDEKGERAVLLVDLDEDCNFNTGKNLDRTGSR